MIDPKVALLVAALAGGYFVYDEAIKPAAVAVAHVTKTAGVKTWHGLRHIVGK